MKKAIILLSAIMSVMPLTVMADEYIDPQTNVVYTYEPGQPTASVKAGYEEEVIYYERIVIYHPGSPDAAGDVVILDKFTVGTAEYVVTSINKYAFQRNKKIKSVIIPETVTDIGAGAFEYCDSLTAVQLPDGLTQIANELFYGCSQLVSVNIPSSVYSIGNFAFNNCSSLTDLTLPASLTIIGKLTFNDTPWFNALYNEAPDGPFYIGPQLVGYKGDAPTGELTIKDGTTSIGFGALRNCNGLTSVTIPESVAYIDYEAFYKCEGLTAVHITNMAAWCNIEFQEESRSSSNPLFYAHHLYLNGEEVTDLVIPDGVTSIGRYAFDNCTALTSVTIPDGVTTIGNYAFRSCGSLTNVTIPSSVTTINYWAFIFCYNLDAVHISDLAAWCGNSFYHSCLFAYGAHFYLKGEEVKDLVIPEGVAGIGNGTFEDYSYLTSVTIPKSVTTIGENAFNGCKNLTDVYSYGNNVPSLGYDVFKNSLIASATLHVPAGSIEEYKTTSPWSNFGNIVALPDNNDYFYYYNGSKIPLTLNENKVVVSIPKECNETSERIQANVQVLTTIGDNDFDIFVITRSDYEQLISLDSWEEDERNVVSSSCYFVGRYNDEVAASPYLNVKIKKEQDIDLLNAYVEEYKLRFDDYKPLLELWYVLSVTPETEKDPLQVANELYETGLFAESEPDLVPLGSLIGPEPFELVTYTEGQMATIILPEEPDASKGKYYRLDRYEDGQIIFEQELQPQAHIPYIIVPNEDFSIDLSTLDLAGCYRDTVSIAGISFIGSYVSETFDYPDGFYIDFIDITHDCRFDEYCVIGALRAYLLVRWDDPYNQGGTRVPPLNKRRIVLRDYETGITSPLGETGEATLYDLQGRMLPSKPAQGIYIKNRQKVMMK